MAEPPGKRLKSTPPADAKILDTGADYVAFNFGGDDDFQPQSSLSAPSGSQLQGSRPQRNGYSDGRDPRNRFDRPKSKHALPGTEAWLLVKTKLGRRFVHNIKTKESLWRIPRQLRDAVEAFDDDEEKKRNAQWSEDQLALMRQEAAQKNGTQANNEEEQTQRRRSESLQREDEQAMMAELAAQAEHLEEQDAKQAAEAVKDLAPKVHLGEASDSEYEYVEVTDSEGEDGDEDQEVIPETIATDEQAEPSAPGPVDFGEDDIAYQLAMMGESYGLDPEEYDNGAMDEDENYDEDQEGLALSDEEAYALFSQMLEEHEVSPFLPWDKIISDGSASSIVFDDRYTILASSKARKEAWDRWSRERAVNLKTQRALEEKKDPRIAYLVFLAQNINTKLYWPEFKRKYKREPEMNDRALHDKERETYYRDLVTKLKLPESKRKHELETLLRSASASKPALPPKVTTNIMMYALPAGISNEIVRACGFEPIL